jgi:hypothetical protein
MQFLYGAGLTRRIKTLCSKRTGAKIAIAYWGRDAFRLLHLSQKKRNIEILCCLEGGKSDPNVIKKFGHRARQNDKEIVAFYYAEKLTALLRASIRRLRTRTDTRYSKSSKYYSESDTRSYEQIRNEEKKTLFLIERSVGDLCLE